MTPCLRIVYMGTPEFAVAPLEALASAGYSIAGVVTIPDKPAGRGLQLQESAVKKYAVKNKWPLAQPVNLRDESFLHQLRAWNADVFVVVAFRMLPEEVFTIPKYHTFNLHASFLPQYRGAAPINRAIMNGETETGVTTFFINRQMDTGNIIFQEATPIDKNENASALSDKLMHIGARLVVKTVDAIAQGNIATKPQPIIPAALLNEAPKITKETRIINWRHTPDVIHNLIRGLSPYPAAITMLHNTVTSSDIQLKLLAAHTEWNNHSLQPGAIVVSGKDTLKVACDKGFVYINELQPAGKQPMKIRSFLAGFRHAEHYCMQAP